MFFQYVIFTLFHRSNFPHIFYDFFSQTTNNPLIPIFIRCNIIYQSTGDITAKVPGLFYEDNLCSITRCRYRGSYSGYSATGYDNIYFVNNWGVFVLQQFPYVLSYLLYLSFLINIHDFLPLNWFQNLGAGNILSDTLSPHRCFRPWSNRSPVPPPHRLNKEP